MSSNCVVKIIQGGAVGAPVGGQILSEVLPYLELEKDNLAEEDIKKEVEIPNVVGLTIEEAKKKLKEVNLGISYEDGEEVIEKETIITKQIPTSGLKIYEGTEIIVEY